MFHCCLSKKPRHLLPSVQSDITVNKNNHELYKTATAAQSSGLARWNPASSDPYPWRHSIGHFNHLGLVALCGATILRVSYNRMQVEQVVVSARQCQPSLGFPAAAADDAEINSWGRGKDRLSCLLLR